jgi:hypothetical protein
MNIPRYIRQHIKPFSIISFILLLACFAFRFGDDFHSLWALFQANLHKAAYRPDGGLRARSILAPALLISAFLFWLGKKELSWTKTVFRKHFREIEAKLKPPISLAPVQPPSFGHAVDLQALQLRSNDHHNEIKALQSQINDLRRSITALSKPSDQPLPRIPFSTFPDLAPLPETYSYDFTATPPLPQTPLSSLLCQVIEAFPRQDFFEERKTQFRPMALGQLDSQLTPEGQHKIMLLRSKFEAADYLVFDDGQSEFLVLNPLSNRFSSSLHDLKEGGSSLYEYRAVHGLPLAIIKIARLRKFDESCWIVDEKGLIEGGS